MAGKIENTIIFVLPETVYLADFSKGFTKLLSFREKMREKTADMLSKVVDDAILGEVIGKNIFIFDAELWIQEVALPPQIVAHLSEEDLYKALSFEAESFSGIPSVDSSLGARYLGDQEGKRVYWISQISKTQIQQIEYVLNQQGSRLLGVAHPGGIPTSVEWLGENPSKQWQRIELWPDVVVCLTGNSVPGKLHIINIAPRFENWHAEAEEWFSHIGSQLNPRYVTAGANLSENALNTYDPILLEKDDHLKHWVIDWSRFIAVKSPPFPIIKPLPQALTGRSKSFVTFFLFVLTFLICFGLQYFFEMKVGSLTQQHTLLKASLSQLEKSKKTLDDATKELKNLEKQREVVVTQFQVTQEIFALQRKRYRTFFSEIAKQAPKDLMVQEISGQNGSIQIKGVCLDPRLADQYANQLKKVLYADWNINDKMSTTLKENKFWEFNFFFNPIYKIDYRLERKPLNSKKIRLQKKS